jgi:hypothetical protein
LHACNSIHLYSSTTDSDRYASALLH